MLISGEQSKEYTLTSRKWLLWLTGHLELNHIGYLVYIGLLFVVQLLLASSLLASVMFLSISKEAFVQAIHSFMLLVYSIWILTSRLTIDEYLSKTNDLLASGVFDYNEEPPDDKIAEILKAGEDLIRKRSDFFFFLMGVSGFSNSFFPLTQMLISERHPDGPLNPYLAHPLYLPFNTNTSLGLTFGFLISAMLLPLVYAFDVTTNDIYQRCIGTLKAQLEILNYSLKNIEKRALNIYKNINPAEVHVIRRELFQSKEFQNCLYTCLKTNVKHHLALVHFRNTFEVSTGTTLLVMVTVATFILGSDLILLLEKPPLNTAANHLFTLVCEIGYPFFLCYCGEDILIECEKLFESLYDTPWIYCDAKFKRSILIMLTITRRPLRIKARVLDLTASLETFGMVMSNMYKFMNLMRQ